jgi:hypothetical protein
MLAAIRIGQNTVRVVADFALALQDVSMRPSAHPRFVRHQIQFQISRSKPLHELALRFAFLGARTVRCHLNSHVGSLNPCSCG